MPTLLQEPSSLHVPKTPKETSSAFPSAIDLVTGTEMTEMSSSTKAASSTTVKGVAGRNMLKELYRELGRREGKATVGRTRNKLPGTSNAWS